MAWPVLDEANHREIIFGYSTVQWEPLLRLIPELESVDEYTFVSGGHFVWTEPVKEFHRAIYKIPIMVSFDWPEWEEGYAALSNLDFDMDTFDLPDKCKLITYVARKERFSEGSLPGKFEDGTMIRILRSIQREVSNCP